MHFINNIYSSLTNPLGLGRKPKTKSHLENNLDALIKEFAKLETPFVIDSYGRDQKTIKSQITAEILNPDDPISKLENNPLFEKLSMTEQMSLKALAISTNYRFARSSPAEKIDQLTFKDLKKLYKKWIHNLALDEKQSIKALTLGKRHDALLILCKYPKMADLVLNDGTLSDSFFTWCMLAKGNPEAWILYNHTIRKIQKCIYLDGRLKISKLTPEVKKKVIRKVDSTEIKGDLKLCLNGKNISLLNPDEKIPTDKGQIPITVQQMFDTFSNKFTYHEMELVAGQLKRVNAKRIEADFRKENWFYDLEPYKVMTKEKFEQRFFEGKILPLNYAAVISVGTNGFKVNQLKQINNHSFLILAVPHPSHNGSYLLLQFGTTLDKYPSTAEEGKKLATECGKGCVARDDGVYALKRHKSFFSVGVSMKDSRFKSFLNHLANDIQEASKGLLPFNLYHRDFNCSGKVAQWMSHLVEGSHLLFAVNYRELSGTEPIQNALFKTFKITGYVSSSLEKSMIHLVGTKALGIDSKIFEYSSWGSQGYGTHPGKQRKLIASGAIPSSVILNEGVIFSLNELVDLDYNWEQPKSMTDNQSSLEGQDLDLDQHLERAYEDGLIESQSKFNRESSNSSITDGLEGSDLNLSFSSLTDNSPTLEGCDLNTEEYTSPIDREYSFTIVAPAKLVEEDLYIEKYCDSIITTQAVLGRSTKSVRETNSFENAY